MLGRERLNLMELGADDSVLKNLRVTGCSPPQILVWSRRREQCLDKRNPVAACEFRKLAFLHRAARGFHCAIDHKLRQRRALNFGCPGTQSLGLRTHPRLQPCALRPASRS